MTRLFRSYMRYAPHTVRARVLPAIRPPNEQTKLTATFAAAMAYLPLSNRRTVSSVKVENVLSPPYCYLISILPVDIG